MKLTSTLTRIDYVVIEFILWVFVSKVKLLRRRDGAEQGIASPGPALDTAELSQEALRLLRLNKIPFARFAAHVLERSQGRGSEILNKPKTFEQLSEEGREPYRRIKN